MDIVIRNIGEKHLYVRHGVCKKVNDLPECGLLEYSKRKMPRRPFVLCSRVKRCNKLLINVSYTYLAT